MKGRVFLCIFVQAVVLTACTSQKNTPQSKDPLVDRGRVVYQTNCIACHNPDPSKPGPIGPEIKGSSRELIEARIMTAGYPQGYQPKRATHLMSAFPYLKNDISALTAFLNQK